MLVVEGDESDRSVAALRPQIAAITNVDLDHHTTFGSRAEVEELFDRWLESVPHVVRGDELRPYEGELAIPGEHNRRNAAVALAVLEVAGVARADAERALSGFRGVARRLERRGEENDVEVFDDYGHHPTEVAAALEALRDDERRVLVLFQPHLYSRTRHLAWEFGKALATAHAIAVAEIYPAREEPVEGVTGKLVVDAVAEIRPGMPLAWTPRVEDGAMFVAGRARPGDRVVTLGAGDVDRVIPSLLQKLA
jgi:UDP-N-acetylmuramate--alanine ligase